MRLVTLSRPSAFPSDNGLGWDNIHPRALRRLPHLDVTHCTVNSRAVRTPRNPLFAINLLDLLIRHSGANHKRETIAFSKRRQSAIDRLTNAAYELVLEGESYRRRQQPSLSRGRQQRRRRDSLL